MTAAPLAGRRFPWWVGLALLSIIIVSLWMHTRVAWIDHPLFSVGPFGVTIFGILFVTVVPAFLFIVNGAIDSFMDALRVSWVLVAVKALLVLGGVLFIFDLIAAVAGYSSISTGEWVKNSLAAAFRGGD